MQSAESLVSQASRSLDSPPKNCPEAVAGEIDKMKEPGIQRHA